MTKFSLYYQHGDRTLTVATLEQDEVCVSRAAFMHRYSNRLLRENTVPDAVQACPSDSIALWQLCITRFGTAGASRIS